MKKPFCDEVARSLPPTGHARRHPSAPGPQGGPEPLTVAIVVPCLDEEAILPRSAAELARILTALQQSGRASETSAIYFVDDGSHDRTWALISDLHQSDPMFKGIRLARNFGHQGAILAGMLTVRDQVDTVITIDADLQDDPTVFERFIDLHRDGCEIVYGVRRRRDTDSFFKRNTALAFYSLMEWMGVEIIFNHGDCRLVGKRALEALSQYREVNLFLRGVFPAIGFKKAIVEYDRHERTAGETKFSLPAMLGFALNGITSFSIKPLRLIALLGMLIFGGSIVLSVWVVLTALLNRRAVQGWASTVLPIYFLGGLQTIFMGTIGEYVGRIYQEVKDRPRFLVEETLE